MLLSNLLTNCASIPDLPIITRLSATRGYYVYSISNKEGYVDDEHLLNGKTFLDYTIESVFVPADSWKEIKAYIIKNCKRSNECNQNIDSWERKIKTIDSNL